jgi:hypothetical protein
VRTRVHTERAYKPLLPLLADALRRVCVDADYALRPYLRAALLREELRYRAYCHVLRRALDTLRSAQVRVVILKGAALAQSVYPAPFVRHSHDIDLMVTSTDIVRAADALCGAGFIGGGAAATCTDASGLPVELHTHPFAGAGADVTAAFWQRSEAGEVVGVPACLLAPADALLQIFAQSTVSSASRRLVWVCDAWLLLARHPYAGKEASRCPVVLDYTAPLSNLLGYLTREIGPPF